MMLKMKDAGRLQRKHNMTQPWYAEWKKNRDRIPVGYRFCDDCHGRTSVSRTGKRQMGEDTESVVCNKCQLTILEGD